MLKTIISVLITLTLTGCFDTMTQQDHPIIPRKTLFGNPDIASVSINDSGSHIAYLAPLDGVLNVFVAPYNNTADDLAHSVALTHNKKRGISSYFWAANNTHIVYFEDNDGDENYAAYSIDINSKAVIQLTQKPHKAFVQNLSTKFPDEALFSINSRRADFFDIYRVNLKTGESKMIFENNQYDSIISDDDLALRFANKSLDDGSDELYVFGANNNLSLYDTISYEDGLTTSYQHISKDGKKIYLLDSRNRNTAALFEKNIQTLETTLLAENNKADISSIIVHPSEFTIQAAASNYERVSFQILDPQFKADHDFLANLDSGELRIVSRTLDNNQWIVAFLKDDAPLSYWSYNRLDKKANFLFFNNKKLSEVKLNKMESVIIKARDNLEMVAYLTRATKSPAPLILYVHGGPRARDSWGYNSVHQWLSNRGYSVLSVNYRGSTGFGKEFIAKGDGQWARKMHDDLIDAVNWAIDNKITTREQVAIMGGSYGGYAALVGLTFTPEVFACGIDIVGPSNLVTLYNSVPPYWKPFRASLKKMLGGDPETESGQAELLARSPISKVTSINKPLLIGQGANDPRVKQPEADQIVAAMKANNIPVSYVLYPDEGHGFARPENRMSFNAISELFLASCLKGKVEPINDDFKNSSHEIAAGKEFLKLD